MVRACVWSLGGCQVPPLPVLPPPELAPPPQPHRHLHRLVVGGVNRGHALDRHPRALRIEIILIGDL